MKYLLSSLYSTDSNASGPSFLQMSLGEEDAQRLVQLIDFAEETQKNLQCLAVDGFSHLVVHNDFDPPIEITLLFDSVHGDILAAQDSTYVLLEQPVADAEPRDGFFDVEFHAFVSSLCPVIYFMGTRFDIQNGMDVEDLRKVARGTNV